MKSNYLWIIDAGHGGLNSLGKYVTAPNKMCRFDDGTVIYEGVINRAVAKLVYKQLTDAGIDFSLIYDEVFDTSLTTRIALANKLVAKEKEFRQRKCILISIHSNAGGGKGFEVFTSKGKDESDVVAEILAQLYKKNFPVIPFRADKMDGDLDKEENFAMVGGNKKTPLHCAAVLTENLFFDERKQADFLMSATGQQEIADTLVEWILQIEQTRPI